MNIIQKIHNRLTKVRLYPIRVFCLHEISVKPEFSNEQETDWMDISVFQQKVLQMRQSGVEFISLSYAHELLKASSAPFSTLYSLISNFFRKKKYAVLTSDDGRQSLHEILPWLIEQKIPVTLFINGKYLDGKEHIVERYNPFHCLTKDELQHYVEISHGLISLQSHGYEHLDATSMSLDDFREQIEMNMSLLTSICQPSIPVPPHVETNGRGSNQPLPIMGETEEGAFHAYTWGRHNAQTDAILKENNIIPIYVDGMKNYNDASCIHRELLNI